MWVTYFFLSYLMLALAIPLCWSLVPVWRRARQARQVSCPAGPNPATVELDGWYAVKMHALGEREACVRNCSEWPARRGCRQACLTQIGEAV